MASLRPLRFCSTTPHFFKIILEDTSRHKLKILKKFVMKYGNSHFDVCIFDVSATEIDYPMTMPKIEEADEDDDLSIEILEGFQPSPKTRRKCPLACPPYKKMRASLSGKADVSSEIENTQPCDMFEKPITNKESHRNKVEVENLENKGVDDMSAEKDGRVLGGLSGTQSLCYRSFPEDISLSCLQVTFLRVLDGRIWSVEFTYTKEKAQFQGGWLTVVKDNNLEVGDVCVFVLIKDIKLLLGVLFFRTSEATTWFLSNGENFFLAERDGGSSSSSQTILKRTHEVVARVKPLTATEKANAFKSDKPSFRIAMHPYSIHYNNVYLPNEFAKTYLTKLSSGVAILQVSDGRTWSVNFKFDHANSRA
ncbi:putative transcription factor B3-Domain family [Rosa chinensis]|uniref:Putative transcription factor B3-Domain family n=1 Tax=Rosa chinensis TaxID=74649 RepID=A0A2P6S0F2_ROSCH|nr:putative transcription factor B3-Domain family [Rosa chinensis]